MSSRTNVYGISSIFTSELDELDLDAIENSIIKSENLCKKQTTLDDTVSDLFNDEIKKPSTPIQETDEVFTNFTNEQKRTEQLTSLFNDINVDERLTSYMKDESDEEELIRLKEKIENLKNTLSDESIPYENIPNVNNPRTVEEARRVANTMQYRIDRIRCTEMFEEIVLTGCGFLEEVFNGETEILGGKPDLRGYSDTLKVKLRRMRGDTTDAVSSIMNGNKFPLWLKFLLEFGPSIFLYTRGRKKLNRASLMNANDYKFQESKQELL